MVKKLFCFLLAMLLLLSLTACDAANSPQAGESTESSSQPNGESTPTGSEVATNPTETQPEETQPKPKTQRLWMEERYITSDGGGGVTTRTYDEKGNLLGEDYKSQSGDVGYGDSYTYDEKGNVLTHKSYDKHSRLNQETTNIYNAASQLVIQWFASSEGSTYTRKSEFTYDENGRLVKKVDTNPEDTGSPVHSEFHYIYSYDEKGNLIKEDWINVNDGVQTPHSWKAWTYDAKGNKLSETDNRGFKTEWTYDDRGNMLSETQYDDLGNFWIGSVYTYDGQSRILTKASTKGDPSTINEAFIYEYDEGGREIARYRCYDKVDKANAVSVFKSAYDETGNKVSEICCRPDGTETSWRYYKYTAIEPPKE